jgi:putative transposase
MNDKGYSIKDACQYFEKTRQGYYYCINSEKERDAFRMEVISHVHDIRKDMPKLGGRKLHYKLNYGDIKIGRDRLFSILREENLLIKRRRKYTITTDSKHNYKIYDNLIKDKEIIHAEEVFVSDITYLHTEEGFCYLSIVGDAYTKKILGKYVSDDLKAISSLKAFIEALHNRRYKIPGIHHSDRGVQYCSKSYIDAIKLSNMMISMSEKGKAYDNPVAERMIGILKDEYGLNEKFKTKTLAYKAVEQAIHSYNTQRPHLSCGYLTPDEAHIKGKELKNMWRRKSYPHIHKKKEKKQKKEKLLQLNV